VGSEGEKGKRGKEMEKEGRGRREGMRKVREEDNGERNEKEMGKKRSVWGGTEG